MASSASSRWTNDSNHLDRKAFEALKNLSEAEIEILHEPYAKAVLDMGDFQHQDILQAVKALKTQTRPLTAEVLWRKLTVKNPQHLDRDSVPQRKREELKRSAHDSYDSDGESVQGSLESPDASSSAAGNGDLQEDGEAAALPFIIKEEHLKALESPANKTSPEGSAGGGRKKASHLRRRLQALREENQRLKRRQLCRKCQVKAVSLTFLPCGHFAFCQACGQSFETCPLCRKTILADVRTFLA